MPLQARTGHTQCILRHSWRFVGMDVVSRSLVYCIYVYIVHWGGHSAPKTQIDKSNFAKIINTSL